MSECRFGQSQVVITPPIGSWLLGYPFPERDHGCEGVHDDLFAKAWVFSDGTEAVALACLDWCVVDAEFTRCVRERVAANTALMHHQVHINYSHSHSAPASMPRGFDKVILPEADPELDAIMVRHVAGVITAAFHSQRKGRLGFGKGKLTGICTNRRDPKGLMDPEVGVIRIEEENGNLAGVIVNYACHPTVLHPNNYLVSRDFPGFMCDAIYSAKGGGIQVAFAQGAGGNISTRWARRGTTFAEAERLGHMLAGEALRVSESIEMTPQFDLKLVSGEVMLPTRKMPSVEETERILAQETKRLEQLRTTGAPYGQVRSAEVAVFGAQLTATRARQERPETVPAEVSLIGMNDLQIAILPGEPFASTGINLKTQLGEQSLVFGYCNELHGYLIPPEEEAEGGYEVISALCSPDAAGILSHSVLELAGQNT